MAVIRITVFKIFQKFPVRLNVGLMIFTCCWVSYMLRVNMSVNILAMVPQKQHNFTSHSIQARENASLSLQDNLDVRRAPRPEENGEGQEGPSLDWSEGAQAMVLGSFFWGYPLTSLIGGSAAERWGPRMIVFYTTLAAGLITGLSPMAAKMHYGVMVALRFILGLTMGFVYPALHALVAQWAPPAEKGKFVSALMGGTLGTVVTWSLSGPVIETFGWEWAFYIPAAMTLAWCAVWWYIVADCPDEHPRILEAEKKYIKDAIGDKISNAKRIPPFKKIATSLPFLAMVVLHFGSMWGLYFIMTVGPKFVSSVLGFDLKSAGAISSLPYLARLIASISFGAFGDFLVHRQLMGTTSIRKWFSVFSHILPGLALIALMFAAKSTALSVGLITLSMGFNGAATLTNLQNHQDLAPNFAGTLYGIANFAGSAAGFATPAITAYFTRNGNKHEQWQPVILIGAGVYIITAIFFILFGTGVTQPWNSVVVEEVNGTQLKTKSQNEETVVNISTISK